MEAPIFPAVRLASVNGREYIGPDGVVLELPSTNKFSVSWPSDARPVVSTPPPSERASLSSSEESEISDGDSGNEGRAPSHQQDSASTTPTGHAKPQPPAETSQLAPIPRFSRALSMPLPSQLGYLRNPHRSNPATPRPSKLRTITTVDSSRLRELSVELADSLQMIIQTMLQVSPPQLLDSTKEQFSACALSVPTSSMSAMFTTMKNLNFISANMSDLCSDPQLLASNEGIDVDEPPSLMTSRNDFDIGEMLQNIGDSLSGAAAQAGVDLVLYHGDDIGLRHVCVKGDENGITYALSHVVRQVLSTALPTDSIELGLLISSLDLKSEDLNASSEASTPNAEPSTDPSLLTHESPLSCTIRISHKYHAGRLNIAHDSKHRAPPTRHNPIFNSPLLCRLLHRIGATLTPGLSPPTSVTDGLTCDFTLTLDRGSLSLTNTPMITDFGEEDPIAAEPTVDQLTFFAESLKGKKVTLYASAKGSFAQHLIGYLTAWGMNVTHISPDAAYGLVELPTPLTSPLAPTSVSEGTSSGLPPNGAAGPCGPLSFIFIDDDVEVLKERLHALRAEQPLRKRPSLAAHHRPRSSPRIARALGNTQSMPPPTSSVVLVHFTSLANYKTIKDVVQSVVSSHAGSSIPLPEVMIIPKPAGPRRFLTALHTAVTKPIVDPFFLPIATSPTSPGLHHNGSFFPSYHNAQKGSPKTSAKTVRPTGTRSNSDRSTKSSKDIFDYVSHCPPSPLSMSDNVEYFSEAATKLGTSPSSGLVIQSPDGQPAGIFFHPRSKTQRNPPTHSMERDKGQLFVPSDGKRSSKLGVGGGEAPITFASLHAVAGSAKPALEPARKISSPKTEERLPPPQPISPSPIPARKPTPTGTLRKPSSEALMENINSAGRRAPPRKSSQDGHPTPLVGHSKAKTATDGNIVPPISVLIVDDNPINQTILSTFMKKKKIKYDLANNGQEAVQKWRTGEFHLILMDIQMPVMDGIQATKEIRRLEQSNAAAGYPPVTPSLEAPLRTPSDTSTDTKSTSSPYRSSVIIVALTASSLQSDRVAALAAGCNDFLTKPVSLVWLNNKIIEWGSIKALQMWADLRPDVINNLSTGQAKNVADRLHVPKDRTVALPRTTTVTSRTPPLPGAGAGQGSSGLPAGSGMVPIPSSPSMFWSPESSSTNFWQSLGIGEPTPPSAETLNELAKDLAQGGRRSSLQTFKPLENIELKQPASIEEEPESSKIEPMSPPPPVHVARTSQ